MLISLDPDWFFPDRCRHFRSPDCHLFPCQGTAARCAASQPTSSASGRSAAQTMAPCGFGASAKGRKRGD